MMMMMTTMMRSLLSNTNIRRLYRKKNTENTVHEYRRYNERIALNYEHKTIVMSCGTCMRNSRSDAAAWSATDVARRRDASVGDRRSEDTCPMPISLATHYAPPTRYSLSLNGQSCTT